MHISLLTRYLATAEFFTGSIGLAMLDCMPVELELKLVRTLARVGLCAHDV